MEVLPVHLSHALGVYRLPDHHRDPFDRLLVSQSKLEGLSLLSGDPEISRYGAEVIWCEVLFYRKIWRNMRGVGWQFWSGAFELL